MYRKVRIIYIIIFFFQAEDGIRDDLVTGVQTCALPIYQGGAHAPVRARHDPGDRPWIQRLRVVSGTDAGGSVLRDADEGEGGLRGPGGIANSAKQQRGARSDHLFSPTRGGGGGAGAVPAGRDLWPD